MLFRRIRSDANGPHAPALLAPLALAATLSACFDPTPAARIAPRIVPPSPQAPELETTYVSVTGGGDWNAELKKDGTFSVDEANRRLHLDGKWEVLPTGFTKLTIDTATEKGQPSQEYSPGDSILALGAPGQTMALRLDGMSASNALIFLARGQCPARPLRNLHWLSSRPLQPGPGVAGVMEVDTKKKQILMPQGFELDGSPAPASAATAPMALNCKDGIATLVDGGRMLFTRDGGAILHTPGTDRKMGTEDDAFAVATTADVPGRNVVAGKYIGLRVPEQPNSFEQLQPFKLEVRSNGTMSMTVLQPDLENPAMEPVEFDAFRPLGETRFFNSTFAQGTGRLTCLTRPHGELPKERMIYCTGSEDNGQSVFNLIAISEAAARQRAGTSPSNPPRPPRPGTGPTSGAGGETGGIVLPAPESGIEEGAPLEGGAPDVGEGSSGGGIGDAGRRGFPR